MSTLECDGSSSQAVVMISIYGNCCRIDGDGVIKVGDFGLSEDVYVSGYFRIDKDSPGVKLPFKWLAPESIQDGVFSEKTDVVRVRSARAHSKCTIALALYYTKQTCIIPLFAVHSTTNKHKHTFNFLSHTCKK